MFKLTQAFNDIFYNTNVIIFDTNYLLLQEFLGTYKTNWFTEEKALKCYDKFKINLKEVQENIEQRNLQLKRSYNRLNPKNIPINVAI